jgi:hypothetical protein
LVLVDVNTRHNGDINKKSSTASLNMPRSSPSMRSLMMPFCFRSPNDVRNPMQNTPLARCAIAVDHPQIRAACAKKIEPTGTHWHFVSDDET